MGNLIDSAINVAAIQAEIQQVSIELTNFINLGKSAASELQKVYSNSNNIKNLKDLTEAQKNFNKSVIDAEKAVDGEKAALTEKEKLEKKLEKALSAENIAIQQLKLQIQEANKLRKDEAKSILESEKASLQGLKTEEIVKKSLNELKQYVKDATIEYNNLSAEQRNTDGGKEFAKTINDVQYQVNVANQGLGNFKDNVGDYENKIQSALGVNNSFGNSLLNMAKSGTPVTQAIGGINGALNVLKANPIIAVIAAIVLIFNMVKKAINESEERTMAMNLAFSKLKPVMKVIGDVFEVVADVIIKLISAIGDAIGAVLNFLGITDKEIDSAEKFASAEKKKNDAILATRKANEEAARIEGEIAAEREIVSDKEGRTIAERIAANERASKKEEELLKKSLIAAKMRFEALEAEAALDDNNAEMLDKLSQARIELYNTENQYNKGMRALNRERRFLRSEERAENAKILKEQQDNYKKSRDLQRKYEDLVLENQEESFDKQRQVAKYQRDREIQDLEAFGKRRIQIIGEINKQYEKELLKINQEEQRVFSENLISNLETRAEIEESLGNSSLEIRKQILQEQFKIEVAEAEKLGLERLLIVKKYQMIERQLIEEDNDIKASILEEQVQNQIEIYEQMLKYQELELKKAYASGIISEEQYNEQSLKLSENLAVDSIKKQIELSKELLKNKEIEGERRIEILQKIKQLEFDLENEITNNSISQSDRAIEHFKTKADEILNYSSQSLDILNEIFTISFENQLNRINEKLKESEKLLDAEQQRLDETEMNEQERAARQAIIDKKREQAQARAEQQQQSLRIKQARWEKSNAAAQAVIQCALGVIKAIPNVTAMVAAGVAGATQAAIIAATPIPSYQSGGYTHGEPISLVGEQRSEVALSPSGKLQLFDRPTLTHFDANTRIFSSLPEFERYVSNNQHNTNLSMDYERLGKEVSKSKSDVYVNLTAKNTWSVMDRELMRKLYINKKLYGKI